MSNIKFDLQQFSIVIMDNKGVRREVAANTYANESEGGLMSADDKIKLNKIYPDTQTFYGTSSTQGGVIPKVVSCSEFAGIANSKVIVKFTADNTIDNPTMNINNTGNYPIYYKGTYIESDKIVSNVPMLFVFTGSTYELVGATSTSSDSSGGDNSFGIPPMNPTLYTVNNESTGVSIKIYVKDTSYEQDTLVYVNNVTVVRKANSMPTSKSDGTTVINLNRANRNNYAEQAFIDTSVTKNTTYYYRLFITSTTGVTNSNEENCISVLYSGQVIYGFKIKKAESNPSTRVEYTDDAIGMTPLAMNLGTSVCNYGSWKNTFILNSFRPVMLKYDGTVDYELNHDNHNYKLDGTASDISNVDYEGNAMVGVKKMWIYCYEDSTYEYCKISNLQINSNYKCYAHINNSGSQVDEIFLPMFEGYSDGTRLRSLSGKAPTVNTTGADEITLAKANGSGWYTDDFINTKLIENICILLTKSCDNQSTLGRGFVDSNSAPLTTGTMIDRGMFWGNSGGKHGVKFLYIENYYGSRWDRIAGLINYNGTYYVKPTRPYNDDGGNSGYTNTTISVPASGYQTAHTMKDFGLLPKTTGGSETTYIPDYIYSNNSQVDYALRGGVWSNGSSCGVSYLYLIAAFSYSTSYNGSSPCYK